MGDWRTRKGTEAYWDAKRRDVSAADLKEADKAMMEAWTQPATAAEIRASARQILEEWAASNHMGITDADTMGLREVRLASVNRERRSMIYEIWNRHDDSIHHVSGKSLAIWGNSTLAIMSEDDTAVAVFGPGEWSRATPIFEDELLPDKFVTGEVEP